MNNLIFNTIGIWNNTVTFIFDIVISVLAVAFIAYICYRTKLSWKVNTTLAVTIVILIVAMIFNLHLTIAIIAFSMAFFIFFSAILLTKPEKELYFRTNPHISNKDNKMTVNETDDLINKLATAISNLSEAKTGALITIEKKDDMSQFIKTSGVSINAEVSPELLQTIFFDKTPLHDGATIIRRNIILWSAVFYQPSQKPLIGKYGSRHRAAIGISEVCDALTIVVSEETGKVSFAYKGELLPVPVAQLVDMLREYINK